MLDQDTWREFQETVVTYTELREKFDRLANQARYGDASRSPSVRGLLYEISTELREYDDLLLRLFRSIGNELRAEIAELSELRQELTR